MTNSILWNNTDSGPTDESSQIQTYSPVINYCDIQDWLSGGEGNISKYPRIVTGPEGNYYLSQIAAGDPYDSPCLDAGDILSDWSLEQWPNGKRINIGAYGGTDQASKNGNIAPLFSV